MKCWILPLALLCATPIWAAPDGARGAGHAPGANVESLLTLARQNNPELAAMRHEATAARERVDQADTLPDPRLRLELQDINRMGSQNPSLWPGEVGSTRYTLTQELPWFGTGDIKRAQAGYTAQSADSAAQAVWADLASRIKLNFAQWYFLSQSQRLSQEILGLMQHLEQIAQARYASGLAPQQDAIRAQTEQSAMRAELIGMQTELLQTRTRVNGLLARPMRAELAEPQSLRPLPAAEQLNPQALEQRARERNPQLAADEARMQAADKGRELALQGRYPTIMVGIAPMQVQNEIKTWDLMLELNIPLWQGTRRAQERESVAMLASARAKRDSTAIQLQVELNENIAALQSAQQTESLVTSSLLPQAELTLQAALVGYEAGKLDFATVLDAQRQIRQAKQSRIKAQAEGQARLAQIERLLGEDL
jgi:cobalt-zinc-cadmium efflux system outer membrane protein